MYVLKADVLYVCDNTLYICDNTQLQPVDTGLSTNGNCYKDLYRILCQNMGFNRNKITYKK